MNTTYSFDTLKLKTTLQVSISPCAWILESSTLKNFPGNENITFGTVHLHLEG